MNTENVFYKYVIKTYTDEQLRYIEIHKQLEDMTCKQSIALHDTYQHALWDMLAEYRDKFRDEGWGDNTFEMIGELSDCNPRDKKMESLGALKQWIVEFCIDFMARTEHKNTIHPAFM